MKIIDKSIIPGGIKIQLEDWREHNTEKYPDLYGYMIGVYPEAKRTSKYNWILEGDTFRLSIATNNYKRYTNEKVLADYESLKNGSIKLESLSDKFWNGLKDMYYLGMDVGDLKF